MSWIKKIINIIYGLIVIFLSVFGAGFTGNSVISWIHYWSFDIDYSEIATNSAVYGICCIFAVVVTLPSMYAAKHYVWPALRFIGLKVRYFFHGY
ncbi:hypothetical protein LH86_18500 [Cedecea neteri]|nr:hypothetical protein LH86_18500 [Cedecea neteri]